MGVICGLINYKNSDKPNRILLEKMLAVQKHRDKSNPIIKCGNNWLFGMSNSQNIIFVKNQPLNQEAIIFEGVHAYVDGIVLDVLKHKSYFEESGYSITAPSCGLIVVLAYREWGMDFMNHLEGEFACAIWDDKAAKLILVRDPYGHKPLHYYVDNKIAVFSSEIKGILAAGVSNEVDLIGLSDYLSLNCIPYPGTIFKNIKQVAPGSMVVISSDGIRKQDFFQHKFNINNSISIEDAAIRVRDKIRDAVKKRMVTDNIYCFLSGGIDSSALVSFASELSDKPINAVSISFAEEEVNELEFAKIMAKHVGAKHHHIVAKPDSFFDMLDILVFHHDSPFTDTSAFPTYYAAKLGRQFTDIILTGDGPDQTMGGSGHHVFAIKNNIFRNKSIIERYLNRAAANSLGLFVRGLVPSTFTKIKRKLYRNSFTPVHTAYDLRSFFPDLVKEAICNEELWRTHLKNNPYRHPESWFKSVEGEDDVNKYLYADIKFYVPDDLMIKVDRMCMAHNLETLSPFQDVQLAKVINTLPGKYKVNVSEDNKITTKYILKKACEGRFPQAILNKKKQGFGIPLEKWLRYDSGKFLREILFDEKTLKRGYFKKKILENFVNDFIENKGDYFYPSSSGIVALLTLELWHRKYIS